MKSKHMVEECHFHRGWYKLRKEIRMANNHEKIVFTTEDHEEVEFYVLEQTEIGGFNYLLIADAEGEEEAANALILREKETATEEAIYDVVENDEELEAISKVFLEMMDDIDIEMNKES